MTSYGCHDRRTFDGYWVQNGTSIEADTYGLMRQVVAMCWIEDRGTSQCQYRKALPTDPRCEGCTAP